MAGYFDDVFAPSGGGSAPAKQGGYFDDVFAEPEKKPAAEGSITGELGRSVARGAVSAVGTGIKGAAGEREVAAADYIDYAKRQIAVLDKLERGEEVSPAEDNEGIRNLPAMRREQIRAKYEERLATARQPVDPTSTDLYKAGAGVQKWGEEQFTVAKGFEDSWTRAIGEGLGSTIPLFVAGAVAPEVTGPAAVGAGAGYLMSIGSQIDDAVAKGASREQILDAVRVAGVPGLSEQIPIETLFAKVPVPYLGRFGQIVSKVLATAAAEGGQEAVQTAAQNLIAQWNYDPNRDITEGVAEAAGIGAIVGGVIATPTAPFIKTEARQATSSDSTRQPGATDATGATAMPPVDGAAPASEIIPDEEPGYFDDIIPKAVTPKVAPSTVPAEERAESPRLTPTDRTSPIPNDIIDDGKKVLEEATGKPSTVTTTETTPTGDRVVVTKPVAQVTEEAKQDNAALTEQIMQGVTPVAGVLPQSGPAASVGPVAGVSEPPIAPSAPTVPPVDQMKRARTKEDWTAFLAERGMTDEQARQLPVGEFNDINAQWMAETTKPTAEMNAARRKAMPSARTVKPDVAVLGDGTRVPVEYAVVEADDLIASQTDDMTDNPRYPQEMQPRDRTRASSEQQINAIANQTDPLRLDKIALASDGAPIVAPDGVVESGNGRTLGIRKAYNEGKANVEKYRAYLAEQGYPVDGMKKPVLVRIRRQDMTNEERREFTRKANERNQLKMSAPEQAMSDATSLKANTLDLYRGGDLDTADARPFVMAFMKHVVSENDRGDMVDKNGEVSQDAIRRIQGALLAKAYGDENLVSALIESPDNNIKAIGGAMMDVAGLWAQMRDEAKDGTIDADVDATPYLLDAVRIIRRARTEGRPVFELVNQSDVFSGSTPDPMVIAFLKLMFRNTASWTQPAGRDKLADALRFYATEARKATAGTNMFGEAAVPPSEIVKTAKDRQYGAETKAEEQGSLLATGKGNNGADAGASGKGGTVEAQPRSKDEGRGETPNWLKERQGEDAEAVKGQMRDLAARAQKIYDNPNNRTPAGRTSAGSEGARQTLKAEAIDAVLRAIRKGETPDQAIASAKRDIRAAIAKHNARGGDVHWTIDDGAYDSEIEHSAGMVRDALMIKQRYDKAMSKKAEPEMELPAAPPSKLKQKVEAKRAEKSAANSAANSANRPTGKIEDFGEKIEGAKKDLVRDYAASLDEDVDIAAEPLSKIFPQPDYAKMADAGVDKAALALVAVIREQIPAKPRKGYKVARWAADVKTLRGLASDLMSGKHTVDSIRTKMLAAGGNIVHLGDTAKMIADLDPALFPAASKWRVSSGFYTMFGGERFPGRGKSIYTIKDDKGRMVSVGGVTVGRDTLDEILPIGRKLIKEALTGKTESGDRKYTSVSVYQDRTTKTLFLGFKGAGGVARLKAGFESVKDARSYLEEHKDEVQDQIDAMRAGPQMRRPENRPREGVDRREGDVSPEQFGDAFGFRGVQFGNYVEAGRRQFELNEAYDGLMDLADTLGIPARAISLNGKLGLAFGARGSGNAKAHYEPGQVVINLTKTKGAGSLAHEWFHAVDDYFARADSGSSKPSTNFMSTRGENDRGAARPAIKKAFSAVRNSLGSNYAKRMGELDAARSKAYWNTTIEKAARGFEKYMVDRLAAQKATNDYLANIDENAGAYPTNAEMRDQGITAAFDTLFKTIETRDTPEGGVEMFSLRDEQPSDQFVAKAREIGTKLRAELTRLGLGDVGLRISEKVGLFLDKKWLAANGVYYKGLIQIAIDAEDPDATLHHEALHALRDMGAFTPTEWDILERKSKKEWIEKHEIREAYGNLPAWAMAEEGIAHAYDAWRKGARTDGIIAKSFKKIKAIINAIGKVFGKDFRTAEDVFASIQSGEVGNRRKLVARGKGPSASLFPTEKVDLFDGPADQYVIPGAEKKTEASIAQRKADAPLKPMVTQRDVSALPLFGDEKDQMALFQAAWHGTPHEFDKFSLEKLGTGEGAQAFGWGLYFTEKQEIAEYYKEKLARPEITIAGLPIEPIVNATLSMDRDPALAALIDKLDLRWPDYLVPDKDGKAQAMLDKRESRAIDMAVNRAVQILRADIETGKTADRAIDLQMDGKGTPGPELGLKLAVLNALRGEVKVAKQGKLYKVEVPDSADLLDWDAKFKDQPSKVKAALRDFLAPIREQATKMQARMKEKPEVLAAKVDTYMGNLTGSDIYYALAADLGNNEKAAAQALVSVGIPGHRFLAGESRSKGEGTRNFVIYDDNAINIEARFQLRAAPATPAERQATMQGFLSRGQLVDRAIRMPLHFLGGIDARGIWIPGKRLGEKLGPEGKQAAAIGGLIGSGIGTAVAGPIGTVAGAAIGGTAGAMLMRVSPNPQGKFGWMASFAENAKRGLIDGYGLDPEYQERGRKVDHDKSKVLRQLQGVMKVLENASVGTNEAKVLQAILTGENVDDEAMKRLSVPIRQAIDDMGAEAVSLGLISAESFERNRGAYLHRVYTKNEADDNRMTKWVSKAMEKRRHRIIGDEMKGRGMFWDVAVDRLMRDVESFQKGERGTPENGEKFRVLDEVSDTADMLASDDGVKIPAKEGKGKEKVLRRVYLPADKPVPERYAGFRDRGTWEVRKTGKTTTLWRDYTKEERTKMGELVDARYTIAKTFMLMSNDIATGRFFKDIASKQEWTASQPPPESQWKDAADYGRFWTDAEVRWVRVPDTDIPKSGGKKRWGALSGKFVRAEIWRDLNEINHASNPNTWRKLLTQWKLNKTGRNPVVHMNNVMSNLMFMDIGDVRAQDLIAGIKAYAKGTADYQEALDNGAFGGDMLSQEIREKVLQPILDEITKQGVGSSNPFLSNQGNTFLSNAKLVGTVLDKVWAGYKVIDNGMTNAYQAEDAIFRMAAYMRRRSQGDSPATAAKEARDQFLNYDIRAPWVVAARNTLLPFISYTYRAVPKLAESLMHRPWKVAKYFAVMYALNALAYMGDDGDDGEERERAALRNEEQGWTWLQIPRMVRMPWRDEHGLPVFFDVRRWIPSGDIFDNSQGSSALPLPSALQFGGPLQLAFEFNLNKQAFTGEEITDELTQDNAEKATTVADWAWKSWAPGSFWTPGSWYWTKIANAWNGATDAQGRPLTMTNAALSSVGIKLKGVDVNDGIRWHMNDFKKVQLALKQRLRQSARQLERGLISQDAFNKEAATIKDKFETLGGKVKDFQKRTKKPVKE